VGEAYNIVIKKFNSEKKILRKIFSLFRVNPVRTAGVRRALLSTFYLSSREGVGGLNFNLFI